ncbi:hypothetical protein GOP47_0006963 [Adiantum capillus-veneris]|uniref:Uncharacterized protein n=1 Tax=Adiantum capillus-veneris TaxID=13818 RepID=A0A9D4ZIV2_ADICA|nr:hypothetical protein GOP47_0006963 [Adiantum capillus-veneris]
MKCRACKWSRSLKAKIWWLLSKDSKHTVRNFEVMRMELSSDELATPPRLRNTPRELDMKPGVALPLSSSARLAERLKGRNNGASAWKVGLRKERL